MKILHVFGERPYFLKIARIVDEFTEHNQTVGENGNLDQMILHTRQHSDVKMSKLFQNNLGISNPYVNFEVGSASRAQQTAEIMKRFEPASPLWDGETAGRIVGIIFRIKS